MSTGRINLIWAVIIGATMPAAVVLSTHLARASFEKVSLRGQVITVKGSAERAIVSDRALWSTGVVTRAAELKAAYADLEAARGRVLTFLDSRGFKADRVGMNPVAIRVVYKRDAKGQPTNAIESYEVSQELGVESPDVNLVAKVAREASDLIRDGIELTSATPQYIYTKLDEMKLTMLVEATANARDRAQRLVGGSGSGLGGLRAASQGVFQITPAYSTEVSGSGVNDTSSIDKVIKAVVTLEYGLD